jgi:hypothetical protein
MSPHALRHFEQSLAAVAGTGLDAADRLDLIAMVDDYVAGLVLTSDLEPGLESVPGGRGRGGGRLPRRAAADRELPARPGPAR